MNKKNCQLELIQVTEYSRFHISEQRSIPFLLSGNAVAYTGVVTDSAQVARGAALLLSLPLSRPHHYQLLSGRGAALSDESTFASAMTLS
ncbi:hypothetical protein J6590_037404 [Homalodisca vitripennis]|nr:hypothetical protein J6590_037404 [Homalodisca vitripennis]